MVVRVLQNRLETSKEVLKLLWLLQVECKTIDVTEDLVNISQINYCILDEADEMLNMGFYEDIVNILRPRQTKKTHPLFSATMPAEVARIGKQFMTNPVEITVGAKNSGSATVSHEFYLVNARDRYEALKRLADANPDIFSVVFCRTKRDTQAVAEKLIEDGYSAAALHGDLLPSATLTGL